MLQDQKEALEFEKRDIDMNSALNRKILSRSIFYLTAWALMPAAADAAAAPDLVYVHCSNGGGDYRISELNHSVSVFSTRYQQYRPLCPDCDIIEWGNRITMKDGVKTYIQIDRMTGDLSIQRNDARQNPAPGEPRSYRGGCTRGTVVARSSVRAF
ncbi:MAG: hypothetical protein JWN66_2463 [Sphingomonas bacterium]|uniref:hypothetical protein n=1 Tax=Sphingomonas bacterium TaxID=1895847 RepID=UPI00260EB41F|nr:hypothetical protein [Sphingomonas bacterium]MDB5705347.1 hypothetical protein [Sphingomonas bacterium]